METSRKRADQAQLDEHNRFSGMLRDGVSGAKAISANAKKYMARSAAVAAMAATLIGCGGGPQTSTGGGRSVVESIYAVVNPASAVGGTLMLPNTVVNKTSTVSITYGASGSSITVSSCSISGSSAFTEDVAACPGVVISAGSTQVYQVSFTPTTTGPFSASFTINSSASNSPVTETLKGYGVTQHSVKLTWNASVSPNVTYDILRSNESGGPYNIINTSPITGTSYTDNTVQDGQTYYYTAIAVDTDTGVDSTYSNQASAVMPSITSSTSTVRGNSALMHAKVTIPRPSGYSKGNEAAIIKNLRGHADPAGYAAYLSVYEHDKRAREATAHKEKRNGGHT